MQPWPRHLWRLKTHTQKLKLKSCLSLFIIIIIIICEKIWLTYQSLASLRLISCAYYAHHTPARGISFTVLLQKRKKMRVWPLFQSTRPGPGWRTNTPLVNGPVNWWITFQTRRLCVRSAPAQPAGQACSQVHTAARLRVDQWATYACSSRKTFFCIKSQFIVSCK